MKDDKTPMLLLFPDKLAWEDPDIADNFYHQYDVKTLDFLKIDAEGYDFDILESHDFAKLKPRLIMVEFGTHFRRQTLDSINAAIAQMAQRGYGAVSFKYDDDGNFEKGNWSYLLVAVFVDCLIPQDHHAAFGNILFYREDDKDFLLTLYDLFETCLPRASVWRKT